MNQKPEQEKYYELTYYTISHPGPSFIHQHIVDAYAAQYADENTKPITLAFALIGLYLHIERNYSGKEAQKAHMQLAKKRKVWPVFNQPKHRGEVTVSDVLAAPPGRERDEAIRKWCASVWEAYRENHKKIIDLVRTELEYGERHPIK
ncbi:Uncharacterised protein [uncultured archaeon]|nr:Uncharacterised protein [uncultured archaeon]